MQNVSLAKEEFAYYKDTGMDGVINSLAMNSLVREDMSDYMVEIVKGLNYYIPSTHRSSEEIFNKKFAGSLPKLLEICSKNFDITFIDHKNDMGQVSKMLFDKADMCVVNLSQNPELINYAQSRFKQLDCRCRVMYIVGRYDESNRYTLKYITNKFHIPPDDIGVIPYNSEFMEAVLTGRIKEFLRENMHCSRRNFNYFFMQTVEELTEKMLIKAGLLNG